MKNLILFVASFLLMVSVGYSQDEGTELNLEPDIQPVKQEGPKENKLVSDPDDQDVKFNHRKSNWVSTFGFDQAQWPVDFEFDATKKKYDIDESERPLYGGHLGFGREFYIPGGFLLSGRLEGWYLGTLFKGTEYADVGGRSDVTISKDSGNTYGANAIGHLGWMFDFHTKNPFLGEMTYLAIELFVEAGVGRGKAYNRKRFEYTLDPRDEYDSRITEEFDTRIVAGGVNLLSTTSGFFLNLKASQYTNSVNDREERLKAIKGGVTVADGKNTDIEKKERSFTVFTLGGGYKF